jgi:hypothetical protein
LRQSKDTIKEEYYKKLLAYEKQQIEIRNIEFLSKIKERVLEREKQRVEWEAEKQKRKEER